MVTRRNQILKKDLKLMTYPEQQRILKARIKRAGKQTELLDCTEFETEVKNGRKKNKSL